MGPLGFWKRNHVPNGFGTRHEGDDAVQTERQPTVRWRTILQGVKQKPKFILGFFRRYLERIKHFLLDISPVNSNRTTAHLPTVEHHVVTLGNTFFRCRDHPVFMPFLGRGKRVVHCGVALCLLVELEHRKVHHPHGPPGFLEQTIFLAKFTVADFDAQGTHGVVDDLGLVGTKENQIAVLGTGARQHLSQCFVVDILDNGALEAFPAFSQLIDLDVGQPLGTVNFDKLGVSINLATAQAPGFPCTPRYAKTHHPAALHGGRTCKHLEIDVRHHIRQLSEFKLDPQVWFV